MTTATPRRAALYMRQSPTRNGEEGIERQRERTTNLANARGWKIVREYIDLDVSASKPRGKGTAWARLLADSDKLDVVVAVDLDRLLRSTRDLNTLIDHGLMAVTVDGEIDLTTADGEFRATMLAGIARFEVRRKGERQTRANETRASKGGVPKGTKLTGYNTDGTVDEEEAAIVKELFASFLRGETLRGLSRTHDMPPSTILGILKNARYAGKRVYKGEVVATGSWPALVDDATFQLVQAKLANPKRKTNTSGSTARKHLGSGCYHCECGDPRPVVAGGDGARYRCRGCGLIRTRAGVDGFVLDALYARLKEPDVLETFRPTDDATDLADLLRQKAAQQQAKRDVLDLIKDGTFTKAEARATVDEINAKLAELEEDIHDATGAPVMDGLADLVENLDKEWEDLSTDRLRTLIDMFMVVTLKRAPRGRKGFDPDSVDITPRRQAA